VSRWVGGLADAPRFAQRVQACGGRLEGIQHDFNLCYCAKGGSGGMKKIS
jgi:hypothetical protein